MADAVLATETAKAPEEMLDDLIEVAVRHHAGTDVDVIRRAYAVAAEARAYDG